MGGPIAPVPYWTARPVIRHGAPMAHVRIDVGQYSFEAMAEYDPNDRDDFARKVHNLMNAITLYANDRGWM